MNSSQSINMQIKKWRMAYHFALINAGIFLLVAFMMFVLKTTALSTILFAPALFSVGSFFAFILMIQSGGALAPIAWFVLGSGVFFGLGAVAGGLHVHPHSDYLFGKDTLYLLQVNLLNAGSVLIVLISGYFFSNMHDLKTILQPKSFADIQQVLLKIFPIIVAIAAVGAVLRFFLFPVAENLILRSLSAKIYLIIPAFFLLTGMLWKSINRPLMLLAGSVFFLEILNGLLILSKYQIIIGILALSIGLWLSYRSLKFIFLTIFVLVSILFVINPIITLGRSHINYHAEKNSAKDRLAIVSDAINALFDSNSKFKTFVEVGTGESMELMEIYVDLKKASSFEERLRALGRRFDVASIQGYLMNKYNSGQVGKTLSEFWAVFIPRIFWPEKPIISRFGQELNAEFYYHPIQKQPQTGSSVAPTYSAEAYWNYGWIGVVLVSALLGLAIGWLTRCWQYAFVGKDPGYFLIAVPIALWAGYVESWIVATCLGEFIILVLTLFILRFVMRFAGQKL